MLLAEPTNARHQLDQPAIFVSANDHCIPTSLLRAPVGVLDTGLTSARDANWSPCAELIAATSAGDLELK